METFEAAMFSDRVEMLDGELRRPLTALYGATHDVGEIVEQLLMVAATRHAQRSLELRRLDARRLADPDWYQSERMVGYAGYADRMADGLAGVAELIPHLQSLGVTYLHLLPVLEAREGENDGGYAVASYRRVDPRLGTMEDLESLATDLRAEGISLCIDVVCNHTADTHDWARRALAGDAAYQGYYLMFPDREMPDAYEESLREIFPAASPGSFTRNEKMQRWVWTTFRSYQWDLNYRNPRVLIEMTDIILSLANSGAEILRLDAVAFMWKELATMCENLPGAHAILQVFRAITRLTCPGVLLKAEAIVPIDDTMRYLGVGDATGAECDLAYHHFLMVLLWSALAEGTVDLLTGALRRMPDIPPAGSWCTYLRCHDDIGWAITPADAATAGLDDHLHREFLSDFYTGQFAGSFAKGEVFEHNPQTGDRRVSGTAASLAGIDRATDDGDEFAVELAFGRLRLLNAIVAAAGGIPLIWSGDELGSRNDVTYLNDPEHASDNRWLHRPALSDERFALADDPATIEARVLRDTRAVMAARVTSPELHASADSEAVWLANRHVFGMLRDGPRGRLLVLGNFAAQPQMIERDRIVELGLHGPVADRLGAAVGDGDIELPAYGVMWLVATP
jgi:amylosucrase